MRVGSTFVMHEEGMAELLSKFDNMEMKRDEVLRWKEQPQAEKCKEIFGASIVDVLTGKSVPMEARSEAGVEGAGKRNAADCQTNSFRPFEVSLLSLGAS